MQLGPDIGGHILAVKAEGVTDGMHAWFLACQRVHVLPVVLVQHRLEFLHGLRNRLQQL